jgi:DNA-binding MarR family transcriptional regulator
MTMPELDEIIHQPVRLRLMAALVAIKSGESADFSFLRDLLGATDGNLGAHLRRLEEAGYIELTKKFVDRKPRTYAAATALGRKVFRNQVAALEEILKGAGGMKAKR